MKQLTIEQRYELGALLKADLSKIAIAILLKVHKSTIYRELKRNSNKRSYNAKKADALSQDRRKEAFKHKKFTS